MDLTWIAYYENNEILRQDEGNTYSDIDRQRLTAFGLYHQDNPLVLVDFRDDQNGDPDIGPKRLIWRKRHQLSSNGNKNTVHLVGWQRQVNGRNIQSICYVTENGQIILGGQWVENRPLMHAIKPMACETDLA